MKDNAECNACTYMYSLTRAQCTQCPDKTAFTLVLALYITHITSRKHTCTCISLSGFDNFVILGYCWVAGLSFYTALPPSLASVLYTCISTYIHVCLYNVHIMYYMLTLSSSVNVCVSGSIEQSLRADRNTSPLSTSEHIKLHRMNLFTSFTSGRILGHSFMRLLHRW